MVLIWDLSLIVQCGCEFMSFFFYSMFHVFLVFGVTGKCMSPFNVLLLKGKLSLTGG